MVGGAGPMETTLSPGKRRHLAITTPSFIYRENFASRRLRSRAYTV
jgi:hypothetical protein